LVNYIFGANYGEQWFSSLSNQSQNLSRVVVCPNPANDYLIISGLDGNATAELFTITGQLVNTINFVSEIKIKLELKTGVYLVKIKNGIQTTTKKIIVK
jgi:hypothetical protein